MGRIVATRWCGGTDNDLADGVQHGSFRADTDAPHADPSCAKRVQCRRPHQAIPLTAHGHTQARALGATLAGPASAVAVSRFVRAQQTAAPYCQRFNLQPQVDADFDEFSLIDAALIEGLHGAQRKPFVQAYWTDPDLHRLRGDDWLTYVSRRCASTML